MGSCRKDHLKSVDKYKDELCSFCLLVRLINTIYLLAFTCILLFNLNFVVLIKSSVLAEVAKIPHLLV